MKLLSIIPSFDESVSYSVADSHHSTEIIKIKSSAGKSVFYMVDDRPLN
jgi:hypothetical protein